MTPETPAVNGQPSDASPFAPQVPITFSGRCSAAKANRRLSARYAFLAVPFLLAYLAAGCATLDAPGFSGGGVPIGGSRLVGRVVSASDSATSLPNVTVKVEETPAGGAPTDLQTTTDHDGSFNFPHVLPGAAIGTVEVTATPADPAYQAQKIGFTIVSGHTKQLIVTLPPASFDVTTAKSLTLVVPGSAVPSGSTVQLQAVVRDAAGNALALMPTLVFDGNFATLNADGTLSVPASISTATGSVDAYWFDLPPQSEQIRVDKNAPQLPPSPPILPKSPQLPGT
jgi:hypothetical protein